MFGTHSGSLVSEVTDPFLRPDCQLDLDHPAGLLQGGETHEFWIHAIPHATKRGQPNTAIETFQRHGAVGRKTGRNLPPGHI